LVSDSREGPTGEIKKKIYSVYNSIFHYFNKIPKAGFLIKKRVLFSLPFWKLKVCISASREG
jgi:hypothetical protein